MLQLEGNIPPNGATEDLDSSNEVAHDSVSGSSQVAPQILFSTNAVALLCEKLLTKIGEEELCCASGNKENLQLRRKRWETVLNWAQMTGAALEVMAKKTRARLEQEFSRYKRKMEEMKRQMSEDARPLW